MKCFVLFHMKILFGTDWARNDTQHHLNLFVHFQNSPEAVHQVDHSNDILGGGKTLITCTGNLSIPYLRHKTYSEIKNKQANKKTKTDLRSNKQIKGQIEMSPHSSYVYLHYHREAEHIPVSFGVIFILCERNRNHTVWKTQLHIFCRGLQLAYANSFFFLSALSLSFIHSFKPHVISHRTSFDSMISLIYIF